MASHRKPSKRTRGKTAGTQSKRLPLTPDAEPIARRRLLSRRQMIVITMVLLVLGIFVVARFVSDRWYGQGMAALRIHRFEVAEQFLQKAATINRRRGEVALMRGRVAWVKGDQVASEKWIQQAAAQGLDPKRIDRERRLLQIRAGSAEIEYSRLSTMLRQHPEDGLATLEAFTAGFLARGNVQRATEMLAFWKQADASDPRIHYWHGMLNRAFGKESIAIEHFEQAIRAEPDMSPARLALADLLTSFFFYPEARLQYQRLVREQPSAADAQLGLAICQLRSDRVDEGLRGLKDFIAAHNDNVAARVALAEHYQDAQRSQDVLATIQPLLDADIADIALNYLAATAFSRLDEKAQSDKYFDKFQKLSRQLESTKFMTEEYEQNPSAELARQIASDLLQCKWEDAGIWILAALSSQPDSAELNLMMAEYLRRAGRTTVANSYEQYANRLRLKE